MPLTVIDQRSALLVIDLQKGIVGAPGLQPPGAIVVTRAAALAAGYRRAGLPVVLVNVAGTAPGRTERTRPRVAGPAGGGGIELAEELDAQPGDHLITKRRRSAFQDTGLDALLRGLGVTQVVVAGISTTSGVEGTARAAYDHGYHVVVAVDAVADGDPIAHANSIERVFPKLGETAATAEILGALASRAGEAAPRQF